MFKRLTFFSFLSVMIVSCGAKAVDPIYEQAPSLPRVPEIRLQNQLNVPYDEQLVLKISLFKESLPTKDNYVNSPGATKNKSERPSVIIAVPAESKGKTKQHQQEVDEESIFGTSGYYNEAEQYVEQDLLRKGFSVLDRSKFEAKLRDLRDKAEYSQRTWWDSQTERALENGEYEVVKTDLKNKFESGKITLTEYRNQIDAVNKYSQRALPGQKRDENEMNDIAEVIRAAQTGADQANYLLQINEVKMGKAGDRNLSIQELPEVQEFINNNPGLSFGSLPYALPPQISANWWRSSLNAKLIEIKTGSIVWLGSHEIESWAAEEVDVTFNITKKVSNVKDVNGKIDSHNSQLKTKEYRLTQVQEELRRVYAKAITKRKYDSKDELEQSERELKNSIRSLESEQSTLLSDIERLQLNEPSFSSNPWKYSYKVQEPIIEPDLSSPKNKLEERKLQKHKAQLVKSVSSSLIDTIIIN
jgi:hypothetical protein